MRHPPLPKLFPYVVITILLFSPAFASAQSAPIEPQDAGPNISSLAVADDQLLASFGSFIVHFLGTIHFFGNVNFGSIAQPSSSCPEGSAYPDGCAGAPANGSFQRSNFFNYARQSGQTYDTRPPWNVAGVDYAVGLPASYVGSLRDPAVYFASTVNGCTYQAANHRIYCDGSVNPDIEGFDFGPSAGFPGTGHDSLSLVFYAPHLTSGNVTIKNNNFKANPSTGMQSQIWTYDFSGSTWNPNYDIESNTFDGSGRSIPPNLLMGPTGIIAITEGNVTVKYNSIVNDPGRPVTVGGGPSSVFTDEFNYFENWESLPDEGHGETDILNFAGSSTSFGSAIIDFNTALTGSSSCDCGTTIFYISQGVSGTIANFEVKNNVAVSNTVGGLNYGVPTYATGTIDNGIGTGPGDVFTVSALSGPNPLVVGQMLGASGYYLTWNISGSGVGSTWMVGTELTLTPSVQVVSTQYILLGAITNSANIAEIAHNTFTNTVYVMGNYGDATGSYGQTSTITGGNAPTCSGSPGLYDSGNYDLISGNQVNWTHAGTC